MLVDHPENPVPEGAISGVIRASDGISLRYATWPSVGGNSCGTVTILQGRAEFIEKYFEVIRDLRARGFAVVAFDWRGQGGSERLLKNHTKGHVRDFSRYRDDLNTILKKVSLAEYPGPHYVLAHSMGGCIFLSAANRLRTVIDRAVLSAPMTGLLDWGWREKWSFRLAAFLAAFGFGRLYVPGGNGQLITDFDGNPLTSDPERFQRSNAVVEAAPNLGVASPTIGWFRAAARSIKALRQREFGPSISLPCLIVAAGSDTVVASEAAEDLASRMKAAGYLEIPGARHELLMERDIYRNQFWTAFDAYISKVY